MKSKYISRRQFLKHSTFGLLSASLFGINIMQPRPQKRPPNIIFFITDDMYPDMFNFLPEGKGKNLTPNIDRLAREGTIMINQYVSSPLCTPSRFSCLTGKYASRAQNRNFLEYTRRNGGQPVIHWNTFITNRDKILPHYLKEANYTTGMVGKNHVIEVHGLEHFQDYYADPLKPDVAAKIHRNYQKVVNAIHGCGFDYVDGIYHNNPDYLGLWKLAVHNLDWITACGLKFIEQNHNKPFFLYFATTVPHDPITPERSWKADRRITANGILPQPVQVLPSPETYPERLKQAGISPGNQRENLLWLDDALGALLQKLEELNILDNTIIFFFNDHGQKAKGTLYQGGIHNPSIVWRKSGFAVGQQAEAKISNIDFLPTILDFAGIQFNRNQIDGKSFKPILDKRVKEIHPALYFELGFSRAVIKGRWKYLAIRYPAALKNLSLEEPKQRLEDYNRRRIHKKLPIVNDDPSKPYSHLSAIPGGGYAEHESTGKKPGYYDADQLYDLQNDPNEQYNLARKKEFESVLIDMKKTLQQFLNELPGKFSLKQ